MSPRHLDPGFGLAADGGGLQAGAEAGQIERYSSTELGAARGPPDRCHRAGLDRELLPAVVDGHE